MLKWKLSTVLESQCLKIFAQTAVICWWSSLTAYKFLIHENFFTFFFFCYNYNEITFLRITVSQTLFQWLNVDFSQRLKIKSYSYHLILNQKLERHSCIKIFLKRLTILYAAADTSYLSYKVYNLFLLYVFVIYH